MHRARPSVIDAAARVLYGRDGRTYPIDRLVRRDGALYCELSLGESPDDFRRLWLLPAQGWVVNGYSRRRFRPEGPFDWYIDIDHISIDGDRWTIVDGLLDLIVAEGEGGVLLDADELADDLEDGTLSSAEAARALRSAQALQRALARRGWSVAALLAEVAPDLPR